MLTTPPGRWAVHGLTFVVWGLAAASAVYWGFKLAARPIQAPAAAAAMRVAPPPDPAAVARLLGGTPVRADQPIVPVASRLNLVGVVARASRSGVALISVDGKPARPYRVGAAVDDGLVLQAVERRRALLGPSAQAPASITLELPPLKK